jgi:hypothetical protein
MKNFDGFNDSETLAYFATSKSRAKSLRSDLECGSPSAAFPKDSRDPLFGEAQ